MLQNELKGKSTRIVFVAFDLLYLNGYDLRKLPLIERKTHLKKIVDGADLQFSESFDVDGPDMFAHVCKVGLEGVVSKVRDSRYVSGRSNDWVKKTCAQRETLTIAGFALDGKKWDGIYLGRRKGNDLIYAGKVDHGFEKTQAAELRKRLTPLIRKSQPYRAGRSRTRGSGSTENTRKSNTAQSPRKEKYDTPSSRASERTYELVSSGAANRYSNRRTIRDRRRALLHSAAAGLRNVVRAPSMEKSGLAFGTSRRSATSACWASGRRSNSPKVALWTSLR